MDRWRRDVASRVTIRNILIREGLAECLGTFILVVSSKVATISCVELTGTFVYETQCKDLRSGYICIVRRVKCTKLSLHKPVIESRMINDVDQVNTGGKNSVFEISH